MTVADIAKKLGISVDKSLDLLEQYGIFVVNSNIPLEQKQLDKINNAIKQAKINEENEKKEDLQALKRSKSSLEYFIRNYKVFIDTCSLLHSKFEKFLANVIPILQMTGNKIIIPLRVIDELNKHRNNTYDQELAIKAQNAIEKLSNLKAEGLIDIRGEENDNFADNVFETVFTKFRLSYKLLLITQDKDLANDILNLNTVKSVKGNKVLVKRINKYGFLSALEDYSNSTDNNERYRQSELAKENLIFDKFKLSKNVTNISAESLKITNLPSEGDTVYTTMGQIRLIKNIASGGEGNVFTTNTAYVAKIYKKEKVNKLKYEKLRLMLSKKIDCVGICWPIDIIHNKNKEFIGYLMPKASGKELQKCLFVKPLLLKNFPNWKKRDTVELCLTILEKIKYLHQRNIILGDINPMNILVVSTNEVYFVDTDSYQIEEFPCPVGTVNYTAPEIQHINFSTFLRSFGNEYFAVATLLFMIMLPGKPPYSQQGGENPVENIIKMDFSYPLGNDSNKKTPDGPWRYIWSHMTYDIKEAFYKSFRKEEEYSTENERLTPEKWIEKLSYYFELLDSGKFGKQDKMSEELFPTRFKKIAGMTYIKCKICNKEVNERQLQCGICRDCLNKGEVYNCSECGEEILYSNYDKYIKNSRRYDTCYNCFNMLNSINCTRICVDCGRPFDILNREYKFYESKGLELPKRCSSCRNKRSSYSRQPQQSSHNNSSSSTSGGGFCFITTAVCEYFNKQDDCYELTMFREFRDNWLINQPNGEELVKEYYRIAPKIVEGIEISHFKGDVYQNLWDKYLSSCLSFIESKRYIECMDLYKYMVECLKLAYMNY